jgi:hypothetical protein
VAVKSVLSIDVDDTKFKQHLELFGKYQAALAKMPANWKAAAGGAATITKANQGIVALMLTQAQLMTQAIAAQGKAATQAKTTATAWSSVAASTKQVYANLEGAARSMLRLGGLTTIVTGLLGGGALFGLDRMAEGVANIRRSALGLGVSPGEQRAFGVDYGRFLGNPSGSLATVAAALTDPTNPAYRPIASLLGGNVQGQDATDVTRRLLHALPGLFPGGANDRTLGTKAAAYGLTNIFSIEDIKRYLSASPEERRQQEGAYGRDVKSLDIDQRTALSWQNLDTQLERASGTIFKVFVQGLEPLTGPLTHLSDSVTHVVAAFLNAAKDRHWIEQISSGLEMFAKYIGTPEFEDNVKTFADDLSKLASIVGTAVSWLVKAFGGEAQKERADTLHGMGLKTADELRADRASGKSTAWGQLADIFTGGNNNVARHNPGGMRQPGQSTGFASFPSDEAGVSAIARQLLIYQKRDHLDTISGIISKYAPSNENDTAAYIKDVSSQTGFKPNQHLNLSDQATLAKVVAAITKHENIKPYSSQQTQVIIRDATGGNVNTTVTQLGYGGGSAVQ